MAVIRASVFFVLLAASIANAAAAAAQQDAAAASNALKEDSRTLVIDAGSTDEFGITDVFLYIGTFTLAVLSALAIIGLIYGVNGGETSAYEAPAATGFDSYTAYDQVYQVARSLYDGYKKYEEGKSVQL